MVKGRREQDRIAALRAAEAAEPAEAMPVVELGLRDRSAAVVARAAAVAERMGLRQTAEALLCAAERVAGLPAKGDPGCIARIALVQALRRLEIDARAFFRRMITARQDDWSPSGFIDIAAPLRAEAALAIAGCGDPMAPALLCDLLFERPPREDFIDEPAPRTAAARALASTGIDAAAYVIRAKLRSHPRDTAEVTGECCCALALLEPAWAEDLVNETLAVRPDAVPIAAVGIGESRCRLAVPLLKAMWQRSVGDVLETGPIMMGMALTRTEEGFQVLLDQLHSPEPARAKALEALQLYQRDSGKWARVQEAMKSSGA